MKLQHGFTLIELLIAVAIIAILSALAMPAYQNYVIKAKIPDATSNLATMRVRMEQYFQDNVRYSTAAGGATCGGTWPFTSNYFTYSCVANTPVATNNTYTITATGPGSKGTAMNGFTFTINENNTKTSNIVAPAPNEWQGTNNNCWITKVGGVC
jgi:type IV pilus assembly protein PilE